ncbi:MAG TPA: competence/damage-inducible protein A [Bacillales bacterium]|nr:competence/damage-inducible protein A [Bacillales bacterium]
MDAEIIAVGSELLLGQIANTNAQFLSRELASLGVNVYYHTAVGDNVDRLRNAIANAEQRADLIIFSGGLGPTKDDLTKETIATMLGKPLVFDETAMADIRAYYAKTKRTMTENNKKQALVIEGSEVLPNDHGMAPGMAVGINGKTYMLFPGPPRELQPMFENYGKHYLQKRLHTHEHIISRVLRFFGIGESKLETEILDLIDAQTNPTIAPLAGFGEVTLRLTAKSATPEEAYHLLDSLESTILQRVGRYFYGYDHTTLENEVFTQLQNSQKSIACAESLTGGWFAKTLTDLPGASDVFKGGIVCYTNEVKEKVLRVPAPILQNEGAISESCAKALAENVRELLGADIGISFTGVAGPGQSEGKEAGTVYIGLAQEGRDPEALVLSLAGGRNRIRSQTVKNGLFYVLKRLKKLRNTD